MLAHRLRRWCNIEPSLDHCPVLSGNASVQKARNVDAMLVQSRPASPAVVQSDRHLPYAWIIQQKEDEETNKQLKCSPT